MRAWWLLAFGGCGFTAGSEPLADAPRLDARIIDAPAVDAALVDARVIDGPLPMCPGNYVLRNGSHYRYESSTATWLAAELDCENDSTGLTHLAVLGAGELATVDALSSASRTWVGLTDLATDASWRWVTGGAGPNLGNSESCGQIDKGSTYGGPQLQDDDCSTGRSYVCECDLTPADPTTY